MAEAQQTAYLHWIPYTARLPEPGQRVAWIAPSGAVIKGTFVGGLVWLPAGSSTYVYYTPAFWRVDDESTGGEVR